MPTTPVRRQVGNLPAEVTSFIGRRREAAELKRLLESSRLVTLTGFGGVGKTRLALRLGKEVRRAFPDGVWFVDLSAVHDPGLVAEEVGVALGLRNRSGRWPAEALANYVADQQLLLVLDNCEHVLNAAALVLARVLRGAPQVRVLATSRQPLGIAGERILPLAPLSLPDPKMPLPPPDAFAQYDGLSLLVERAQAATSDFVVTPENGAAVIQLCTALDGVPLAIELAAVRLRMFSPEQVLARLDDRFRLLTGTDPSVHPRQRSLQALIDWSFELCPPAEQNLWERLSVFPGSFDVDAALGVCDVDESDSSVVLNALAGLVDRSLVVPHSGGLRMRYRLLENVRQYGWTRLTDSREHTTQRRRHRDYFHRLTERAETEWCGPEQRDWVARLTVEHHNLRAALAFSLSQPGEQRIGLDLAGRLRLHWLLSGYLAEGRQWLDRALTAAPEPCPERAKALCADAYLRLNQGDVPGASSQLEESRRIAEEADDAGSLAHAIELQGMAALLGRDWPSAASLSEQALARHRALGNRFDVIMTLARCAIAAYMMGAVDHALSCHADAVAESEACGDSWGRSTVLWMQGIILLDHGDLDRSRASVRESLLIRQDFGDRLGMGRCVEVLAWIAAAGGEHDRAARLLGVAQPLWRITGGRFFPYLQDRDDRCRADIERALGAKTFAATLEDGARMSLEDGIAFALGAQMAPSEPSFASGRRDPLTRREQQIAELVIEGLSNRDIAERLVISQRTAEAHVEHILTKLGFNSRTQIAAWMMENRKLT